MDTFNPPEIKQKRPPGRQPKLSVEYQVLIAKKVVEGGMTFREASRTFGISQGAVNAYVVKYRKMSGKIKKDAQATKYAERVENYRHETQIKSLKLEIGELYLENLLLKKALQHSVQMKKENSSVITSENLDQLKEVVK